MSEAAQALDGRPARVLGQYQLVAELARGGMGRVYLARRSGQAGFERFFAVKVMHHQLADDHDAVLMLLDEAHIASRLHHPNVVSVLDIGTYDAGYYLVMDYVEGCSLHELLRRNRADRPPRLIVPVILEGLYGLHAVHALKNEDGVSYGIVHRDVSPHNLLVGLDGGARVIDFGIAKASARFADTQSGMYKGKLAYMAPEQLKSEEVDARADVWAAGVTLYDALTAFHPFKGSSDPATLHKILSGPIAPPSTIGLKPPACLDDVIMKALMRDPTQRYQTAREFAEELRKVALANDLLGAPSEIAGWVETTYGEDLSERRRRIKEVHSSDPVAIPGQTPSLPRLWSEGQRLRASGEVDVTKLDPSATPSAPQTQPTAATPARNKLLWVAAIGLGLGLGGLALIVETMLDDEAPAPAVRTAHEPSDEEPLRVTAPVVNERPTVEEVRTAIEQPAAQAPAEPAPEPQAPVRRPPRVFRPRPAEPVAQAPEPPPQAPAEPQPQAPPQRRIERNPYLRGE